MICMEVQPGEWHSKLLHKMESKDTSLLDVMRYRLVNKNNNRVSSTGFEWLSFHHQEDFYMQFYGIFYTEIIIKGCMNILYERDILYLDNSCRLLL